MLFILLHLSCCLLNSGFDSRRKDHLVFPRILICDDKSIFAECWCLFCPGISQHYCKTYCHCALLWWMTKVAAILFKGKQETYKKLLKREWENNVQFQVAWQSDLLKLSTYLLRTGARKPLIHIWIADHVTTLTGHLYGEMRPSDHKRRALLCPQLHVAQRGFTGP